ncbi:MAG: hypothetical protein M0R80_01250 [Proteobacteria bacterium]|jgi:hypothetical protein|nr:hypothetical protein [Pseudomonadota bacterium]
MDKDAVKELIARIVADIQGCKATELPVHIANHVNPTVRQQVFDNNFDFPDLLQEMIAEGKLVEVEYVLPNMTYKCKSFLLPAGTILPSSTTGEGYQQLNA